MGFQKNLSADVILAQVQKAREHSQGAIRNVVFMGMGEPLDNYEEVLRATEIMVEGVQMAPKHITVSTSGVVPRMKDFFTQSKARLALSLNASCDEQRNAIMPINKRWPLEELIGVLRNHTHRPTFIEYVLLAGINDSADDAQRVAQLLQNCNVRINLLPYNPHPQAPFRRPTSETTAQFAQILVQEGYRTLVRAPRGDDMSAACGQLLT